MAEQNVESPIDNSSSIIKDLTDVEIIKAKVTGSECTSESFNSTHFQDVSVSIENGSNPVEIMIGTNNGNNAKSDIDDSKALRENLDSSDHSPNYSSVENSKVHSNPVSESSVERHIASQASTNFVASDGKADEVKSELKEIYSEKGDNFLIDQNTNEDENLILKSGNEITDFKTESSVSSYTEDAADVCSKTNNIVNEPLIDKNIEETDMDASNEQTETEEAITDKSDNVDSIQPVILEVKSIAPGNIEMTNDFENIKPECNDFSSETCEQVKKMSRFDKDNGDEFEALAVKTEIFEEEENITDVNEDANEDKMEVDDEYLENMSEWDDGLGASSDTPEVKSEVKNEEVEDFIFIEDCRPGIKNTNDKSFIKEGSAEILLSSPKNVFYNPVQEFNRDMSVAALTVFAEDHQTDPRYKNRGVKRKNNMEAESVKEKMSISMCLSTGAGTKVDNGITILEALSATGLRSIRYAKEIAGVKQIIANDISEVAVENIKKNAEHNGVGDIISTSKSDASLLMYQHLADDQFYDAIDLDPYGCPSRFLDSAVQAVRDGGILLVTCTDMAVLAGNSPETCHTKYGSVSLRNTACHEMAIRIALQCIESHANRYGRYIVPLLSFSADFYIRIIVQVYTSPVTCKKTTSKLSMVYQCVGCNAMTLSPLGLATQVGNNQMKFTLPHSPPVNMCCSHCFYQHIVGGPIWSAPIHKASFVERMLNVAETHWFGTSKRMQGMLEVIKEELPDVPLYYTISGLCSKIHCLAIPLINFRSALLNAGYRVSLSHAAPNSIKSNAPVKTLWDIIRCWVQANPISQRRLVDGSVSAAILFQEPTTIANFELHPKATPNSRIRGLLRFQQNPHKNWGPGTRSRANVGDNLDERRIAKQNKKSKKTPVEIIEVITLSNDEEDTSSQ